MANLPHHSDHGSPKSVHIHHHGSESSHPPQSPPWSILRMTLTGRLLAAVAVSVVLWAIVLTAMR